MVLSVEQIIGFGLAALILIVVPGPSVIFAISQAVVYGRRAGVASVVGHTAELFVVITLAIGLGSIVARSVVVFTLAKLAGAAYLVWLGIQSIRHRRQMKVGDDAAPHPPLSRIRAVRQGFIVGVTSPKAFRTRPRFSSGA